MHNLRFTYLVLFLVTLISLVSCKQAKLSDARRQYEKSEYFAASETFKSVYAKTKRKQRQLRATIAFEMGESYRKLNSTQRAANAYSNAVRYSYPDSTVLLRLAQMQHKEGKYPKAEKSYLEFLSFAPNNEVAKIGLKGVRLSNEWRSAPTRYNVKRMDIFNSPRGEFSPAYSQNDAMLFFSSSREEAKGDKTSTITGTKNNDFFYSVKNKMEEWEKPKMVEGDLNTEFDEGTASFSPDGNYLYYTFCPENDKNASSAQIYVSSRAGSQWTKGEQLKIVPNDSVSVFAHPAISPSGRYLYFVSDMSGGFGGKDIWRTELGLNNAVLFVENLGESINTQGDELFPYVRNDSTLYFSSDGHPGMGGLDIFKAVYRSETKRWKIENMQFPVNSSSDDFGIAFERNAERGFFSSNRNDARGRDHIYSFEYPETNIFVEGFTIDKEDEIIAGASISVVGNDGSQHQLKSKNDGTYRLKAKNGVNYVFMASADGFLNLKKSLRTEPLEKDTVYYVDFEMSPYTKPVILENIFYDFDKATLRPESKEELDELISLLNDNPSVSIELSAHTDRKGFDEYNNALSLRRAQSVVEYLVAHGIDKNRLSSVGYGKTHPKTITANIARQYDFLHEGDTLTNDFIEKLTTEQQTIADQLNRRTEFKVVDDNY